MSPDQVIVGVTTVVVLGVGAQWIGRRLRIPSLLLLLPAGLLAGDVLGLIEPEETFGDALFPVVTLLVALLLFQSGLRLRIADLPRVARRPVAQMVTLGLAITFLGASMSALLILGIGADLAFLLGAILVVSGPTVVRPLLEVVRPQRHISAVLDWESTALDPLGAALGVVVLNLILAADRGGVHPLLQMGARLGLGVLVGTVAGWLLVFVMSRFLLTDDMEAAVALMLTVSAFSVAELALSEAGLFATLTMGFVAGNQRQVATHRINGFGETLEVLIIGTLFVVLGALVEVDALREHGWETALLVAVLVVIVRPLAAAVSLVATPLRGRERAMIGWMDPRGIVAAATAAQFSSSLSTAGIEADFLGPVAFGVILGTGIIYSLTARPVTRLLGVMQPTPKGVGLLGDDAWLWNFAHCLRRAGVSTLILTSERTDLDPPKAGDDLPTVSLWESEERIMRAVESSSIADVVVSNPPGAVATLVEARLVETLGRRHVLRIPREPYEGAAVLSRGRWSPPPFGERVTGMEIERRLRNGASVQVVERPTGDDVLLLAAVAPNGSVDLKPSMPAKTQSDILIALVGGNAATK